MTEHDTATDLVSRDIVITGSRGRLGRALMATASAPVHGWDRPLLDLDDSSVAAALVRRDKPELVIHSAAMTAVDDAARIVLVVKVGHRRDVYR